MSVAHDTSSDPDNSGGLPLVSAGSSDRCAACGANLAVDQRYCVECGTRRGAARFQLSGPTAGGAQAERMSAPPKVGAMQRIMRPGASTVMLLGLFILLLALGIGVLIGHNGNGKQTKQPINVVANFGSGGGSDAASSTPATASSGGSSGAVSSSSTSNATSSKSAGAKTTATAGAAKAAPATKAKAGAAAAATKIGGTAATSKSTVGSACAAGSSGCVNGKQTGNLFGG